MVIRKLVLAALGAASLACPDASTATAKDTVADTTCDGVVFDDGDGDGRRTVDEPGLAGARVVLTDRAGARSATTTDDTGRWSTAIPADRYPLRLEFHVPARYRPSPTGAHNGTAVQFVTRAGDCDAALGSFAVYEPGTACRSHQTIVAGCFTPDRAEERDEAAALQLVAPLTVDDATVTGGDQSWLSPVPETIATVGEIGTVYGIAADQRRTVYAASFVKRHASLRSALNPRGNPTTIYRIAPGRPPEVLVTVDPSAGDPHVGSDDDTSDRAVFDHVFRSGLGDLDVDPDGRHLYTVDLGRRELVTIAIPTGEVVDRLALTGELLGVADCAVTADDPFGDLRPFGLGHGSDGELLLGVVCSAESTVATEDVVDEDETPHRVLGDSDALVGYVFAVDPEADRAQRRLAWALGNDRGDTRDNGMVSNDATWHPWVGGVPFTDEHEVVSYPQPAITDLAVDADGNLIVALGDRWGHQTIARSSAPRTDGGTHDITETVQAGDLQRACPTPTGWSIEGSGCAGGWGDGFEFFDGDSYGWHAETALGSVLALDGGATLVASQMDPVRGSDPWWSGGIARHDTATGDYISGARLYDGNGADRDDSFEHASGITDLALLCNWSPTEVGGRIWHDLDEDGAQDPAEPAIPDVTVELRAPSGEVVATAVTDRAGGYAFGDDSTVGLVDGDEYMVTIAEANFETGPFGPEGRFVGLRPTVHDPNVPGHLDSDGEVGTSPSPVAGVTVARVTIGDDPTTDTVEASVDHSIDFGFRDQYDLAVATRWVRDDDTLGVLAFEVVVHNQGSEPSGPFEISNRIPAGTSLIAASRGVTRPGSTELRWSFGAGDELAPGATRRLTVLLLVDDETQSPFVNVVQLVDAAGVDDDSTPNDARLEDLVDRAGAFRDDGTLVDDNGGVTPEDDADIATVYLHRVSGRVWVDIDRDAKFEPDPASDGGGGEPAGAGVAVVLRHRDGTLIEQQWTNHEGIYRFTMVPSDTYTLEIPADEFDAARPLAGNDWMHSPFRTGDFEPGSGIAIPLTLEPIVDAPAHRVDIGVANRPSDPWFAHLRLEWLVPGLVFAAAGLLLAQRRANRAIAVAG